MRRVQQTNGRAEEFIGGEAPVDPPSRVRTGAPGGPSPGDRGPSLSSHVSLPPVGALTPQPVRGCSPGPGKYAVQSGPVRASRVKRSFHSDVLDAFHARHRICRARRHRRRLHEPRTDRSSDPCRGSRDEDPLRPLARLLHPPQISWIWPGLEPTGTNQDTARHHPQGVDLRRSLFVGLCARRLVRSVVGLSPAATIAPHPTSSLRVLPHWGRGHGMLGSTSERPRPRAAADTFRGA